MDWNAEEFIFSSLIMCPGSLDLANQIPRICDSEGTTKGLRSWLRHTDTQLRFLTLLLCSRHPPADRTWQGGVCKQPRIGFFGRHSIHMPLPCSHSCKGHNSDFRSRFATFGTAWHALPRGHGKGQVCWSKKISALRTTRQPHAPYPSLEPVGGH